MHERCEIAREPLGPIYFETESVSILNKVSKTIALVSSKRPAFCRSCESLRVRRKGKGGEPADDPASITACKSPRWRASV
jgi:molybdenum cofactor biosynthesis enzyme MoaA